MYNKVNFFKQSMDEIVFDCRNKSYGAYVLRETYQKHLLKAIGLAIGIFVFGLYATKISNTIDSIKDQIPVVLNTDTIVLIPLPKVTNTILTKITKTIHPSIKSTVEFKDPLIVEKELANSTLANKAELKDKDPGTSTTIGNKDNGSSSLVITEPSSDTILADPVFKNADQKAEFIGGQEALDKFLIANLIYPRIPKEEGIEGETIVGFVVNIYGKVEHVYVLESSGDASLDAEAIRVIKKTTSMFRPGRINRKAVRSACKIPITFEIID